MKFGAIALSGIVGLGIMSWTVSAIAHPLEPEAAADHYAQINSVSIPLNNGSTDESRPSDNTADIAAQIRRVQSLRNVLALEYRTLDYLDFLIAIGAILPSEAEQKQDNVQQLTIALAQAEVRLANLQRTNPQYQGRPMDISATTEAIASVPYPLPKIYTIEQLAAELSSRTEASHRIQALAEEGVLPMLQAESHHSSILGLENTIATAEVLGLTKVAIGSSFRLHLGQSLSPEVLQTTLNIQRSILDRQELLVRTGALPRVDLLRTEAEFYYLHTQLEELRGVD
ncbi:MAG: hypothetical protein AAGD25_02810 [Cyanobacteria bacterium P01_F01_bin.150]